MKGLFTIVLLTIVSVTALSQRRDRPQTLLGDGVEFTSGFGGFMIQLPTIDGEISSLTGGGGAVLINNQFYFGGYGLGLADDKQITVDGTDYDMDYGHGGLILGFIIRPESLIHAEISSKIGWGEIAFKEKPFTQGLARIDDRIFIVNPTVAVEANMTEWFKINFGVGYQLTNGVDNFYFDKGDFDGVNFNMSFLFGWFR